MANLRSQILPPIFALPPEILITIFLDVVDGGISGTKTSSTFSISLVCSHWRDLALATSSLWRWIDSPARRVEMIQTLIIRAKDRPLSVLLPELHSYDTDGVAAILEKLYRTQELRLWYYHGAYSRLSSSSLKHMAAPAPLLKALDLVGLCLPDNPFLGSLPSVRDLSLDNCGFRWEEMPHCPLLRSLSISHPDFLIDTPSFLTYLSTLPLLEKLDLELAFEDENMDTVRPTIPIELPKLTSLSFTGDSPLEVAALLQHLRFPVTCNIRIDTEDVNLGDYLALFPALKTCRTGTGMIKELQMVARPFLLRMKIFEEQGRPSDVDPSKRTLLPALRLEVNGSYHNSTSFEMGYQICQNRLEFHYLERLDLFGQGTLDPPQLSFWQPFASLPNLKTLAIRQIFAVSFLDYVWREMESSVNSSPFDTIHNLVYDDPSHDVDQYTPRFTRLATYLRARADRDLALTTLTLVEPRSEHISDVAAGWFVGLVHEMKREVRRPVY
ncbi:hypothetical protein BDN72DRAFT_845649 [Pluteus cervinus]|uniref:Uncharacterized protein n=1 Tax=Pluteus cervinus TaxID=181527 RepID=A0ACD3AHU5_9AGAR|nr:hypothetical protein BDN72DRAFT_845649 [Pluteus cervinus]